MIQNCLQRKPHLRAHSSSLRLARGRLFLARVRSNAEFGAQPVSGDKFMGLILLIIVLLLVVGALPSWPYSTGWGYYPSGGLGLLLLILVILLLMGRL
jgi:hypothetical protein